MSFHYIKKITIGTVLLILLAVFDNKFFGISNQNTTNIFHIAITLIEIAISIILCVIPCCIWLSKSDIKKLYKNLSVIDITEETLRKDYLYAKTNHTSTGQLCIYKKTMYHFIVLPNFIKKGENYEGCKRNTIDT